MSNSKTKAQSKTNIQLIVVTGLFIALTYVFTAFVNVTLPIAANGGLIHLGNIPLFFSAIIFGKKVGALSGSIGMTLFDVLSGWGAWAPTTFITNALIGYFVGWITEKRSGILINTVSIIVALIIKVVGYFIGNMIMFGNLTSALLSIPGDITQIVAAAVVVLPVVGQLKKMSKKQFTLPL